MTKLPLPSLLLRRALLSLTGAGALNIAAALVVNSACAQSTPDGALDDAVNERLRSALGAALVLPSNVAGAANAATNATRAVASATNAVAGPVRVEFEIGRLDPRLRLTPCRRVEPHFSNGVPLWGRTRVGLRCLEGDKLWNVSLPVTIKVFAKALVLPAALPAGTTLSAQHLALAEVDIAAEASPALLKVDEALGRTLARPLTAGSTLRAADLRQRQWFAAGETVQVVARGEGFVVVGEGLAVSAGVEGAPAKVKTESGRILSGQPVADRRVEVVL